MFRYFLFSIFFIVSTFGISQHDSYYKYIENKGQWPKQVLYKCDLENGNLYLEKDGLKFNFWDNSELMNLHANFNPK